MTTKEIGERLVALCRAHKNVEAVDTLMSEDVVSVEARGDEAMPAVMKGRAAVRGKNEWWVANHVVHSSEAQGPWPNEDRFTVVFKYVVSPKFGAMAGKKVRMEEVALYTVEDGKITREEFFYDMESAGTVEDEKPAKKPSLKKAAAKKSAAKMASAKTKPATKAKAVKVPTKTRPKAKAKSVRTRRRR